MRDTLTAVLMVVAIAAAALAGFWAATVSMTEQRRYRDHPESVLGCTIANLEADREGMPHIVCPF